MKKIIDWIGKDGLLHIVACYLIAITVGIYTNIGIGYFAAIFAGFAKEIIWDGWLKKGAFEFKDLVCDVMGATIALIIMLIDTLV